MGVFNQDIMQKLDHYKEENKMSKKISWDTITNADILFEIIEENRLTGGEVFDIFVGWHGRQLCTEALILNLEDEGYDIDEYKEEEEEEDDEE